MRAHSISSNASCPHCQQTIYHPHAIEHTHINRISPPLQQVVPTIGPLKHGRKAFPPPCSSHCQPQPCIKCTYIVKLKIRLCEKCGEGAACASLANLAQFCTILAGDRHFLKRAPILPLKPGLKLNLHQGLMLQTRIWGRGRKVCSVGDPVTTGCGCRHRNCNISPTPACFQVVTSLRVVTTAKHENRKQL